MGQEGSRNCFPSFVEITDDDEDMHRFNKEVHKRLAALAARQARGEPISDRQSPPPNSTEWFSAGNPRGGRKKSTERPSDCDCSQGAEETDSKERVSPVPDTQADSPPNIDPKTPQLRGGGDAASDTSTTTSSSSESEPARRATIAPRISSSRPSLRECLRTWPPSDPDNIPRRAKENLARWYRLAHPPPPPPKTPAVTCEVIKDMGMDDEVLAALDRDPTWTVERYEGIICRSYVRHMKRQMRPPEQRDYAYDGGRPVKLKGESTNEWFADFWNAVLQDRVCGWNTALNHYGKHWVENHW